MERCCFSDIRRSSGQWIARMVFIVNYISDIMNHHWIKLSIVLNYNTCMTLSTSSCIFSQFLYLCINVTVIFDMITFCIIKLIKVAKRFSWHYKDQMQDHIHTYYGRTHIRRIYGRAHRGYGSYMSCNYQIISDFVTLPNNKIYSVIRWLTIFEWTKPFFAYVL